MLSNTYDKPGKGKELLQLLCWHTSIVVEEERCRTDINLRIKTKKI